MEWDGVSRPPWPNAGRLAGLFIDELLTQAIAGDLVDLPDKIAASKRKGI